MSEEKYTSENAVSAQLDESVMQKRLQNMQRTTKILFYLTIVLGVFDVLWLALYEHSAWDEIAFRLLQYVAMVLVLAAPMMLKRFHILVPISLSVAIGVFAFGALVLGDGLDLYGRFTWWDSLLHAMSGVLLSLVALWLIHIIMAHNDKYVYLNKYFLALFLVCFSVAMGAMWEIIEYSYDSIFGTNTQQFMASTTGSLFTSDDVPLAGHDALQDTMVDLILDFAGSLVVAIYSMIRHEDLKRNYALMQMVFREPASID